MNYRYRVFDLTEHLSVFWNLKYIITHKGHNYNISCNGTKIWIRKRDHGIEHFVVTN